MIMSMSMRLLGMLMHTQTNCTDSDMDTMCCKTDSYLATGAAALATSSDACKVAWAAASTTDIVAVPIGPRLKS